MTAALPIDSDGLPLIGRDWITVPIEELTQRRAEGFRSHCRMMIRLADPSTGARRGGVGDWRDIVVMWRPR